MQDRKETDALLLHCYLNIITVNIRRSYFRDVNCNEAVFKCRVAV